MTAPEAVVVRPVRGLPEVGEDTDLSELIASAAPDLADGDILVVSSKIVSKAEGRVVHGTTRAEAVDAETVRVVAARGETRIVQTRHGFVMAAAGVDASNVEVGSLVLLPLDPDASARALRAGLAERLGVRVGVVITDTFGRPWRLGQTDLAVGAAGVVVLDQFHGRVDTYGNELAVTAPALADELAAAADLVKGKLTGVPVAVVSGLSRLVTASDGEGVRAVVRPAAEDLFGLGRREAWREGALRPRTTSTVGDSAIDLPRVRRTIAEALGTRDPRLADRWELVEVEDVPVRKPLLEALALPSYVPLLLVVYAGNRPEAANGDVTAGIALGRDIGAVTDRLLLALAAEGVAVIEAADLTPARPLLDTVPRVALPAIPIAVYALGGPEGQMVR